jgi:putative hydrolase of the HAD superfamily
MRKIVLDAGGVLIPNFLGTLWNMVHDECGIDTWALAERWRDEMRYPFWAGQVPLEEFWHWLGALCGHEPRSETILQWRQEINHRLNQPLPAAEYLTRLRAKYQIYIWTNHYHDWVIPALQTAGVDGDQGDTIIVSSLTGYVKPSALAYREIAHRYGLDPGTPYIDDSRMNLRAAGTQVGWSGIYADAVGEWLNSGSPFSKLIG